MTLNHLRIVTQCRLSYSFFHTNKRWIYSDQFTNILSIEFTMHVYVCTLSDRLKTTYSFLYFLFINYYFMFTVMTEHIILCYVFLTYKYYSLKVEYTIWILYCKGNVYKMIRKYGFISYRIFIHKDHDISLMLHTRVWFLMLLTRVWFLILHTRVWILMLHTRVWFLMLHTRVRFLMLHTCVWFLDGTLQSLQFHIDRKSQITIISYKILA